MGEGLLEAAGCHQVKRGRSNKNLPNSFGHQQIVAVAHSLHGRWQHAVFPLEANGVTFSQIHSALGEQFAESFASSVQQLPATNRLQNAHFSLRTRGHQVVTDWSLGLFDWSQLSSHLSAPQTNLLQGVFCPHVKPLFSQGESVKRKVW